MSLDVVLDTAQQDDFLVLEGVVIEPIEILDLILRIQDFEISEPRNFQEEVVLSIVDVDSDTLISLGVSETL